MNSGLQQRPASVIGGQLLRIRRRGASGSTGRGQRDREKVLGDAAGQVSKGSTRGSQLAAEIGQRGDRTLVPVADEFDLSGRAWKPVPVSLSSVLPVIL